MQLYLREKQLYVKKINYYILGRQLHPRNHTHTLVIIVLSHENRQLHLYKN